jgi:ketosteroid isomerase-like protein
VPELTPDDDEAQLVEANARFYRAFESLDLAEMDGVWVHGEHVGCIHPGWCLLVGWEAVRQSWEAIFKGAGEMRFSVTDVRPYVNGELGWVTCTENILSEARGQVAVTALIATNLFERRGSDWLMIHHHASHMVATEPPGGQ